MTAPTQPATPTPGRVSVDASLLDAAESYYLTSCADMWSVGACGVCDGCKDSAPIYALVESAAPLPAERAGVSDDEATALLTELSNAARDAALAPGDIATTRHRNAYGRAMAAMIATAAPLPPTRGMSEAEAVELSGVALPYAVHMAMVRQGCHYWPDLRAAIAEAIATPPAVGVDRAAVESCAHSLAHSAWQQGYEVGSSGYQTDVDLWGDLRAASLARLLALVFPAAPPPPADDTGGAS